MASKIGKCGLDIRATALTDFMLFLIGRGELRLLFLA
jgi:hypothetical protein